MSKSQNYLEIFNEAIIFVAGFLSIAYTEVCKPGKTRQVVGMLCVFFFVLMAAVNISFIIKEKILLLKNKICSKK